MFDSELGSRSCLIELHGLSPVEIPGRSFRNRHLGWTEGSKGRVPRVGRAHCSSWGWFPAVAPLSPPTLLEARHHHHRTSIVAVPAPAPLTAPSAHRTPTFTPSLAESCPPPVLLRPPPALPPPSKASVHPRGSSPSTPATLIPPLPPQPRPSPAQSTTLRHHRARALADRDQPSRRGIRRGAMVLGLEGGGTSASSLREGWWRRRARDERRTRTRERSSEGCTNLSSLPLPLLLPLLVPAPEPPT